MISIQDLPEEIILSIFKNTTETDQNALAKVCKQFKRLANDKSLERHQTKLAFFEKKRLENDLKERYICIVQGRVNRKRRV